MREIVSPDVYENRYKFMSGKSPWYYIALINQGLTTNEVSPDGVINVKIKYNINGDLIDQIVEFYESVGWTNINIILTGNVDSLYGTTTFVFNPPAKVIHDVKRLVRREL
mgnify:CR=1 FL=1